MNTNQTELKPYWIFDTKEEAEAYLETILADEEEVERLRAKSSKHYKDAADSFERCDTDGFLSQWASGITGDKERLQASLAECGGYDVFPCLLDLETGELRSTKTVTFESRYHYGTDTKWVVPREGQKPLWVTLYQRLNNYHKKGLRLAYIVAPAYAAIAGGGTGLAGAASCYVTTKLARNDAGLEI